MSVQADDEQTDGVRIDGASRTGGTTPGRATGHALFLVAPGVRTTRPTWPGLQAFVEARGGLLVTADHLDILARHLRDTVRPADARRARHPLRSAWWIVPFVACLGGEWFLRRRRGER